MSSARTTSTDADSAAAEEAGSIFAQLREKSTYGTASVCQKKAVRSPKRDNVDYDYDDAASSPRAATSKRRRLQRAGWQRAQVPSTLAKIPRLRRRPTPRPASCRLGGIEGVRSRRMKRVASPRVPARVVRNRSSLVSDAGSRVYDVGVSRRRLTLGDDGDLAISTIPEVGEEVCLESEVAPTCRNCIAFAMEVALCLEEHGGRDERAV